MLSVSRSPPRSRTWSWSALTSGRCRAPFGSYTSVPSSWSTLHFRRYSAGRVSVTGCTRPVAVGTWCSGGAGAAQSLESGVPSRVPPSTEACSWPSAPAAGLCVALLRSAAGPCAGPSSRPPVGRSSGPLARPVASSLTRRLARPSSPSGRSGPSASGYLAWMCAACASRPGWKCDCAGKKRFASWRSAG